MPMMHSPRELAEHARAWPFEEARKLLQRLGGKPPEKGYVLFETGYGPSGLPHIGTFGEVVRTTMVRKAFEQLSDIPTRLFCFSDDMDGLRKVPTNIPNREAMEAHLGKPLTSIPDPFGEKESFAHQNNGRLCAFLDSFGFQYEFQSSTEWYKSGRFDAALVRALECYDEIMAVMLPSLGAERRESYSPFLPLSPSTGRVLQVPLLARDAKAGTVTFRDEDGTEVTQSVTGGRAKLQWKPDWAMRWFALQVDYEMSGKDLIDSVKLSNRICRILGNEPPLNFTYELFLDQNGEKISKSKGNGLSVEEWLEYAPAESLSYFMYQKPGTAKRLHFDVIPKSVDDYVQFVESFPGEAPEKQVENAAWHIHGGKPPSVALPVGFSMLLNLASAANAEDSAALWGFIRRYAPGATPETAPLLDRLVRHAVAYYRDHVLPEKKYRPPSGQERAAMLDLRARLDALPEGAEAEPIQNEVYAVGKAHGFENLRDWFKALYEVLLGQSQGPRMGSFIRIYGLAETKALMDQKLG
jgi:lysyl-tRNA synthetase class 1